MLHKYRTDRQTDKHTHHTNICTKVEIHKNTQAHTNYIRSIQHNWTYIGMPHKPLTQGTVRRHMLHNHSYGSQQQQD